MSMQALAQRAPLLGSQARGGSLLDHLLVAALHGAVAFAQVDGVAVGVGQHLDLDVARVLEELLHVHVRVAERGQGLGLGHLDGGKQVGFGVHHTHAAPAAAAGGLDDDRVAHLAAQTQVLVGVVAEGAVGARHAGHAGGLHGVLGGDLVAHQADVLRFGANEDEAASLHALGEVRVLGQEAVARVDGDRVGDLGGGDQGRDVEVAVGGFGRADADRFVREAHVLEVTIGGGVHRHGLDAELAAGAQDAQRDLATVGDEDLVQHGGRLTR